MTARSKETVEGQEKKRTRKTELVLKEESRLDAVDKSPDETDSRHDIKKISNGI